MTPAQSGPTTVVVVDGSNIATEGRSMPSLAQLQEAVMAFAEEFPEATVTVVVDATFGHRIEKKEQAEFDAAVAHNEVVAPPAGAIGRGDAFVLSIANKVGARILSNDSFQEFHGDYPWLFDEGRLIGGKPVPYVGWVFVERLPVKGAVSRKATRTTRGGRDRDTRQSRRTASPEASLPMPVPTTPPPRPAAGRGGRRRESVPADVEPVAEPAAPARQAAPAGSGPVNDLLPFLDFVEHHPVGSSVNGVVESYSSHGAYVTIGDLHGYVPLRLMGDPPPRSARELMRLGEAVTLVVTSFAGARRSVDLSIPKVAPVGDVASTPALEELAVQPARTPRKRTAKKVAAPVAETPAVPEVPAETPPAEPAQRTPRKRSASARSTTKKAAPAATPPAVETPPAPEAPPAAEAPAKKTPAKRAAATKAAPAKKVAAATKAALNQAPKKRAAAKQAPAKKAPAKRAAKKMAAAASMGDA